MSRMHGQALREQEGVRRKEAHRVSIYLLCDPSTLAIRYVGRAVDPRKRKHGSGIEGWGLLNWMDGIWPKKPKLVVVAIVHPDAAIMAERLAIFIARGLGCDLTNIQHNR